MKHEKLIKNIIDQIKESQIKLGYVKETVRLYYPVSSLGAILETPFSDEREVLERLNSDPFLEKSVLGPLVFHAHKGRIEVRIPPEGAEYVHENIETPQFLADIIELFGKQHSCSMEEICKVFEKYSDDYVCEKMPEGADFDYALYFRDAGIDAYYYCVKEEMGHTIYHRFSKEDYLELNRSDFF